MNILPLKNALCQKDGNAKSCNKICPKIGARKFYEVHAVALFPNYMQGD